MTREPAKTQTSKRSEGIEITVSLGAEVVSSRWFPLPGRVDAGDSARFSVFFPLSEVGEVGPDTVARLRADGYELRPVNGVQSVGGRLLESAGPGRVRLCLPAGVRATVDGPAPRVLEGAEEVFALPCSGEIRGAGAWRLRFSADAVAPLRAGSRLPRPGFFTQAVAYGFFLLGGLLWLSHMHPAGLALAPEAGGTRTRLAMLQVAPRKPRVPQVTEEPVARVQELRVAPRRKAAAPRARVERPTRPALRTARASAPLALTSEAAPELAEGGDGPPASDDGPPELDGPGIPVPALPSAPPPAATRVVPPPPPPVKVEARLAVAPRRVSFPAVDYPEGAKHLGLEGKVRMRLFIDRLGNVVKVEVLSGLHPLLDRTAEAAARRARYEPALDTGGQAMAGTAIVTVRFELEEE